MAKGDSRLAATPEEKMTLNSDMPWPSIEEARTRVLYIQQ